MKPSIYQKLENLAERFEEVSVLLSDPDVIGNQDKFRSLSQEYAQLNPVVDHFRDYRKTLEDLEGAKEMLKESDDPEIRELAKMELAELEEL